MASREGAYETMSSRVSTFTNLICPEVKPTARNSPVVCNRDTFTPHRSLFGNTISRHFTLTSPITVFSSVEDDTDDSTIISNLLFSSPRLSSLVLRELLDLFSRDGDIILVSWSPLFNFFSGVCSTPAMASVCCGIQWSW